MARLPACLLVLVASLFARPSLSQAKDPLKDFCRRWGHQTAQVDGRLYIDGGQVTWNPESANPGNITNTWLLYSDLNTTTQDGGMPQQYANLTKNGSVPSVSGGVLWPDQVNKAFYLYGGDYASNPEPFALWCYDVVLNQWNQTKYTSNANSVGRVSWGASATMAELGVGYYYGGWMNGNNTPGWSAAPMMSNSLIRYDMTAGTLNNNSGPDNTGRAEGVMVSLPASDSGLLVYFGGIEEATSSDWPVGANMSTIHIYDIASSKWYSQTATGTVPPMRRRFCGGATWAPDHSSYNIHIYGGFGIQNETGFDDVYVLSLPSFQWVQIWPADGGNGTAPHGMLSCSVVDSNQMLVMGGYFTYTDDCDSQQSWGQHNMNMGENGPQSAIWDKYNPTLTSYVVPSPITSAVGGGATGGATVTKPSSWGASDLSVYFTRVASFSARTATRRVPTSTNGSSSSSSSSNHTGAIVGGVLGGLVALVALLSLILFCLHRRKRTVKEKPAPPAPPPPPPQELPSQNSIHEMASPTADKWAAGQQGHNAAYAPVPTQGVNGNHASPYDPKAAYDPHYHGVSPNTPNAPFAPESPNAQQQNMYPPDMAPYAAGAYAQPPSELASDANAPYNPYADPATTQYYPPPPAHSGSPAATHQSHETQEMDASASSKTNTPAQFYATPAEVGGQGASDSPRGSTRSLGSRPARGRFVEVGDV